MTGTPLIKRFLQHQSEFMAYLMAVTRDFDAAEEIFQNAAIVVMEHAAEPAEPIRDFRAWAKEIVRRQALFFIRHQTRKTEQVQQLEPELLEQIGLAFQEDESPALAAKREKLAMRQCVREANPDQRQMLHLRYEQRATFPEIAAAVGKTEAAVQRALSRIRKRLHDCVRNKLRRLEGAG